MFKKIWLICAFTLTSLLNFSFAEENCQKNFHLSWTTQGIINQNYTYELISSWESLSTDSLISFSLSNKKLSNTSAKSLQHTFSQTGSYTLKTHIKTPSCEHQIELPINIYDRQILYIGENSDFLNFWFEEQLNAAGFLFTKKLTKNTDTTNNEFITANELLHTPMLIINDENFLPHLHTYINLKKASPNLPQKQIMLLTNTNQKLLKRSLSQYAQSLENDQLNIISPLHFMNLLSDIALNKEYLEAPYITHFTRSLESWPKRMVISYLVDELLKSGIPIQILGILLCLAFLALVISFLRQIVGLSVYGVYRPLLLALIAYLIGIPNTLAILLFALISILIIKSITNTIYLLHSSKVSLAICCFLIVSLWGYYLLKQRWRTPFMGKELTTLIVFPYIAMLMISEKLFPSFTFWKKGRRVNFLELIILTSIAYFILSRSFITNLLLSYPELLFAILIINIIIWRFTGLQLVELFRFMPLIKKHLDQEEE